MKKILQEFEKKKKEERERRKKNNQCNAIICHGAGHQTKTFCDKIGPHKIHHTIYGRYEQEAAWKGMEICTDFFDNPPDC